MASVNDLKLAMRLWNWKPHSSGQRDWMKCGSKVKVAACGRRWGKSESMAIDIALYALTHPGSTQLVIAPTDDLTKILMQQISSRLHRVEHLSACLIEKHSPYWSIALDDEKIEALASLLELVAPWRKRREDTSLVEPTQVMARTAGPDGKGLRGRKAHRVIVDEAAYVPDSVMEEVVTPLLADYNGQLVMISTPAGRNHFWRAFERGRDPGQRRYRSFQFPTSLNPYIPAEYIDNERRTKPERVFQVEYEAIFADAEGQVFRYVSESCSGDWEKPREGRVYIAGLDLARLNDFTVLTILDGETGRVVRLDRYNKIDWPVIKNRVLSTLALYNDAICLMEINSIGDVLYGDLQRAGGHVRPFATTAASKTNLINGLAVAFEQGCVHLPRRELCPVLVDELQSYQYKRTDSGYLSSGAPDGMHDDCVMSLALAWKQSGLGGGKRMTAV